jgi:serine/threonine protein kinase
LERPPTSNHNLHVLLLLVEQGTVPETEGTTSLKLKWAEQIKHSLTQLHDLAILWRDVKTDDVLIDENEDAVLLDFGGGNTIGWVDEDKYGTMEGEQQGLQNIMKALGVE